MIFVIRRSFFCCCTKYSYFCLFNLILNCLEKNNRTCSNIFIYLLTCLDLPTTSIKAILYKIYLCYRDPFFVHKKSLTIQYILYNVFAPLTYIVRMDPTLQ